MARHIKAFILTALLLFAAPVFAQERTISVIINGGTVYFDVPPLLYEDRVLVPMRAVFEALGADVTWVGDRQMIIATHGESVILMEIGMDVLVKTNVLEGASERIALDVPPQIVDERTLVPIRAVAEALGAQVEWDGTKQQVLITK